MHSTHEELATIELLPLRDLQTLAKLEQAADEVLVPYETRVEDADVVACTTVSLDTLR